MKYALVDKDGNIQGMFNELPNIIRLPSGSVVNCPSVNSEYESLKLVEVTVVDNRPSKWHAEVSRDTTYDGVVTVIVHYEDTPTLVPQYVTRRQAKLALLQAGLLSKVEAAIANSEDLVKINWEDALEFNRYNPLIISIGESFNLTSEQMDNLFRQASEI